MALTITTQSFPDPVEGMVYAEQFAVSGAVGPLTWSVTAGAIPAGLTLDTSTGEVAGTPTLIGPYSFTIHVTDETFNVEQAFAGYVGSDVTLVCTRRSTGQTFTINIPFGIPTMWDYIALHSFIGGQPVYLHGLNVFYKDVLDRMPPWWKTKYADLLVEATVQEVNTSMDAEMTKVVTIDQS